MYLKEILNRFIDQLGNVNSEINTDEFIDALVKKIILAKNKNVGISDDYNSELNFVIDLWANDGNNFSLCLYYHNVEISFFIENNIDLSEIIVSHFGNDMTIIIKTDGSERKYIELCITGAEVELSDEITSPVTSKLLDVFSQINNSEFIKKLGIGIGIEQMQIHEYRI